MRNVDRVLADVAAERARQDRKWGPQSNAPEVWLAILTEEVGEAAQEVLGLRFGDAAKAKGDLRTELLHVAAVAVAIVEDLDFGVAGAQAVETPAPYPQSIVIREPDGLLSKVRRTLSPRKGDDDAR